MYELNAIFIFGNCEKKKILWKYVHALCIYQHKFSLQNVQLLFAMEKVSHLEKLKGDST